MRIHIYIICTLCIIRQSLVIRAGALVFIGNLRDYQEIDQDVDQGLYSQYVSKPTPLPLVVPEGAEF